MGGYYLWRVTHIDVTFIEGGKKVVGMELWMNCYKGDKVGWIM